MFLWLRYLIGCIVSALGSRRDLILENLALRQQLLSLHAKRPRRRLSAMHKLFWVLLRRSSSEASGAFFGVLFGKKTSWSFRT
jgi:putative transposase